MWSHGVRPFAWHCPSSRYSFQSVRLGLRNRSSLGRRRPVWLKWPLKQWRIESAKLLLLDLPFESSISIRIICRTHIPSQLTTCTSESSDTDRIQRRFEDGWEKTAVTSSSMMRSVLMDMESETCYGIDSGSGSILGRGGIVRKAKLILTGWSVAATNS